jgi:hypothetical protein
MRERVARFIHYILRGQKVGREELHDSRIIPALLEFITTN